MCKKISEHPLRKKYERELLVLSRKLIIPNQADKKEAMVAYNKRMKIKREYLHLTPEDLRQEIFKKNIERYGNKYGPTFEYLVKKYDGCYHTIIKKSITPNRNVDKLLGRNSSNKKEENE